MALAKADSHPCGTGPNLSLANRPMESDVGTQRSIYGIDGIKVLVLNHTYEPLHFCNVKRAIIMVLQGKAEPGVQQEKCLSTR
jgi:hypothetical protein